SGLTGRWTARSTRSCAPPWGTRRPRSADRRVARHIARRACPPGSRAMRIAVVGGTGLVGRHTVSALRPARHEAIARARSLGVDAASGEGLDEALRGVEAVVDTTNVQAPHPRAALERIGAVTRNLLAAGRRARVRHHVLLSIVGVDRIEGNAHYAGKRLQEELVSAAEVPVTIQRATQFHEFAG